MDTPGEQKAPETKETPSPGPAKNTLMGVLAYIGPLVIISYFIAKNDPFVRFHIGQGSVLLVLEVASWFVGMMFWPLFAIVQLVNVAILILAAMGIVHVLQGKEKELPLVGKYSKHFPI